MARAPAPPPFVSSLPDGAPRCLDCRHLTQEEGEGTVCTHPQVAHTYRDFVTGKTHISGQRIGMARRGSACGPMGRLFAAGPNAVQRRGGFLSWLLG